MELETHALTKRYGSKTAVDRLSLVLSNGVYGLLGANGAGKSTLMRLLCGLQRPSTGQICLDGQDIASLGERYRGLLGYLPQNFAYYPDFTARDFLLYIAALKGIGTGRAGQRASELLEAVGLEKEGRRRIRNLSGGMKQRLGIAQAMLNEPRILILDEPTAGLDPAGRENLMANIRDYHRNRGLTILLVSHSMDEIAQNVDRILVLKSSHVLMGGTPREVFARGEELLAAGLDVPQVTRVAMALRDRGLPIDPAVYTVEELERAIQALRKGGAPC